MQRSAKQEANQAANEGGKEVTGKVALEVAPKEVRRLPRPPLAPPAGAAGQQTAAGPHARPRVQLRGYEHTNHLTQEQAGAFRTIVDTYIPDLHDPAAVEVLLVLLEVCHILEVSDYRMRKIFGARQLHALATWGDIVPPKQRPPQLQRAWVWAPNTYQPKLYPIAADGTVQIYIRETPDAGAASEPDTSVCTDA